jgi:hypothetical protein
VYIQEEEEENNELSIVLDHIQQYILGVQEDNLEQSYTFHPLHIHPHWQWVVLRILLYMHSNMFVHFHHKQGHTNEDNHRRVEEYIHIHIHYQME